MLKLVAAFVVSITLTNILTPAEPGPTKDIPELAPLSNWAGAWTGQIEKPMPRGPGPATGEWIVDGRYLQQKWKIDADANNPALSATVIMTYDVDDKVYRNWQFLSDGSTAQATGEWDAATRTMTWTERKPDGATVITKASFPNADLQLWTITMTDDQSKTVFEMNGNNKRQKK